MGHKIPFYIGFYFLLQETKIKKSRELCPSEELTHCEWRAPFFDLGIWDLRPGTWDSGPGSWDLGLGTYDSVLYWFLYLFAAETKITKKSRVLSFRGAHAF